MTTKTLRDLSEEAYVWLNLLEDYPSLHDALGNNPTPDKFAIWQQGHKEVPIEMWRFKELADYYQAHPDPQENINQYQTKPLFNDAGALLGFTLLPFVRQNIELMEHDPRYLKITEELKNDWLKTHNAKDFNSKEGIDFLHGSLEDKEPSPLEKEAEQRFRGKNPKRAERYDKKKTKIYKKLDDDPSIAHFKTRIEEHVSARISLLGKAATEEEKQSIKNKVEEREWDRFVAGYENKATAYAQSHDEIKKALERKAATRTIPLQTIQQAPSQTSFTPINPRPPKNQQLIMKRPLTSFFSAFKRLSHQRESYPPQPSQGRHRQISSRIFDTGNNVINMGRNAYGFGKALGNIGKAVRVGSFIGRAATFATGGGTAVASSEVWVPILAAVIIILLLLLIIGIAVFVIIIIILALAGSIPGGGTGPTPTPTPGPVGGGNIASCTFYRGGDPTPGLKFGNTEMPATITEISGKVGVPASIVAGIMRVESPQAISTTDSSYVTNDYDSKFSIDSSGNPVAYGVMQFTPGTFINTYGLNSGDLQTTFGKTDIRCDTIQRTCAIDPQASQAPTDLFRIYSIRDSITAAAYKVKRDKQAFNGADPWNEDAVNAIAANYYGCLRYPSCSSGPNSYGGDLWKSYSECQAPAANLAGWPTNGTLTQGPQGVTDHNDKFYIPYGYEALDIANSIGTPIYATFNGLVKEVHDCQVDASCAYGWGGYGSSVVLSGTSENTGQPFTIVYGHLSQISVAEGSTINTGDQIGLMGNTGKSFGPHLHWEFRGLPMTPPNIPEAIIPSNCDIPSIPCSPATISH